VGPAHFCGTMSYLRPARLQPERLEAQAGLAWCRAVIQVLSRHKHFFQDSVCLRVMRARLGEHLARQLPHCLRQQLFQQGCQALRREVVWSALRDFLSPDMFVPFLSACYTTDTSRLEVPGLIRVQDRVTVLDTLQHLGTHGASSLALKLFDCPTISAQEQALTRQALAGFPHLHQLILWKACDDSMLEVVGATCLSLTSIDIWKSTQATDQGVRALLGLDLSRPRQLCSSLREVAIKDTSVSDCGAFHLLIHCHGLVQLQYSQDSFLQQLQWRIEQNFLLTGTMFRLTSAFFQVTKASQLQHLGRSLPRLEELTLWTAMESTKGLLAAELSQVSSLKLGGLNHPRFLHEMTAAIGPQLCTFKVETVHFDIDIHTIGTNCPALKELHIVNARVKVGERREDEELGMFKNICTVSLFLVQYPVAEGRRPGGAPRNPSLAPLPGGVAHPATGHTALHALLAGGRSLQQVQVSGSPALTDACMERILGRGVLTDLRRLVITHPLSLGHMVVPLTTITVNRIQRSCPHLECLGDLKHWAVTPAQRRRIARRWP